MKTKILQRLFRSVALMCAMALGLTAYAATTVAVWDGDFNVTTKNGITFNANGNTVAQDGSTVTIASDATVAPYLILPTTYQYVSVAFTVSDVSLDANKIFVLLGAGNAPNLVGVFFDGTETVATKPIANGAAWTASDANATVGSITSGTDDRTFVVTYDSGSNGNGLHLYEAGNSNAIFGGATANSLRYSNYKCDTIAIGGGKQALDSNTGLVAMPGLVIKKIAVYTSTSEIPVAQSEIADYTIPAQTAITVPSTMSALNTAVADATGVVYFTGFETVVELDAEPSDDTKAYLQNGNVWNGTVLIKDVDKNNIVPTAYGNPNSTLKLSGVKGYFNAAQYNSSTTPAIEFENSATEGREYGLWQYDGYSFYSGASGTYQYVNTPELKGSGTYKIDTTSTTALFVADKFSSFTGTLNVTYGAVWLGVAVPSRNASGQALVKAGTVRVSETFINNPLSQWTTWTAANGYLGDTTVAAGATNNYSDNRVNFLKADSWKGTVTISAATNNTSGHIEVWLSKLGGANSTIVVNDLVSGTKDYYLNEGDYQKDPTFVSTVDINGDVQFKNGTSSQTITFDKVKGDSATDKLTFAFPTSATLNYKINSLDNFAGTLSASSSTPLTIVNIQKTGGANAGDLVVKVDETNHNIVDLASTTLNRAAADLELKSGDDGYGIYVAVPVATVMITVPPVANATATVTASEGDVTDNGNGTYTVNEGATVTVTYTSDDYEVTGGTFEFTASEGYTVDTKDVATTQYVASITVGDATTKYSTLQAAVDEVTQNKDIVLLANEADGATASRDITFNVVSGEYTHGDIVAGGAYILTTTALEGKTRYSFAPAVIAVTINEVRTLYTRMNANTGIEAANAGPIGTTIEILSGNPADYAEYLPMFDYNSETGVYTKARQPVAAVYSGVLQIGVFATLAEAVAEAESNNVVKLLADVTLTDKLVVSNKTVTIDADSAKTITGQIRIIDGSNVTIGQNITVTSDQHPTIFVLGDVSVKPAVPGTKKSVLVVNGTVLNTNTGFDQTFAICGNGLDTQGADITVNGTVRNANGIAIYQAFPGNLVINGTVVGASAVSIKDGTITVNSGAFVTATLANGENYVGNNSGDSPTGDAIIAPYYPAGSGYGTPVVTITGGRITVADTENCTGIEAYDFSGVSAPDDAATNVRVSGGTFNTAVAEVYCADGYEPKANGDGTYTVCEKAPVPEGFNGDQTIGTVTLTAAQAAWLNGQSNYAALATKIATMDATAFNTAYLLNLDITGDFSYAFTVTGIDVGDDDVTVTVRLTRTGALGETTKINGTVSLTGTDALGKEFTEISTATVADEDFSESGTTTIKLEKGDAKFFQPVIK